MISSVYDYTPYGGVTAAGPDQPFQWSSEVYDAELGMVYYNYRHYNPMDGRWIGRDPIGEESDLNVYRFVQNNLTSYVDILGKQNDEYRAYKFCYKTVIMTHFGNLKSDKVGTRDNKLQPGDIAVGHFGNGQHPKPSDKWVFPFGTQMLVLPRGDDPFIGTVADVGAFDKKHPKKAGPTDWIDIWDEDKSAKEITTRGTIIIKVTYCDPCPFNFSELMMDVIPDYSNYA